MASDQDRREFLVSAAGAAGLTIVPRHVLGGQGFVAPSDKITMAYIGVGTQGLREMLNLLPVPDIQIVAVCDPNQNVGDYRDWNANGLLSSVRSLLGKSEWGFPGVIPGGRDVGKNVVESYYGKDTASGS